VLQWSHLVKCCESCPALSSIQQLAQLRFGQIANLIGMLDGQSGQERSARTSCNTPERRLFGCRFDNSNVAGGPKAVIHNHRICSGPRPRQILPTRRVVRGLQLLLHRPGPVRRQRRRWPVGSTRGGGPRSGHRACPSACRDQCRNQQGPVGLLNRAVLHIQQHHAGLC